MHTNAYAAGGEQLPLPPAPPLLRMLRYLWLALSPHGVEQAASQMITDYGPIVRVELKLPGPLLWLIGKWTQISVRPYILLSGLEANRLIAMSHPDLVQRAPTVPRSFPAPDGTLQAQPSIAALDGEVQIQQRRFVLQAFRPRNLAAYIPHMERIIARRIALWQGKVDIFEELTQMTLEVLARTMLGIEPGTPMYEEFLRSYWPLTLKQNRRQACEARERLWRFYQGIVQKRRRQPGDDALSALIGATDPKDGTKISEEDLLNYAQMLVEFGHSDLALTKTYLTALVATRQDIRQQVQAEQARYSYEAALAFERQLPQTIQLIREVERFYPAVTLLLRYARADLCCAGYRIPAESWLVCLIQQTHLSEAVFHHPQEFDPQRFAGPHAEHTRPYALMGFGAGYHACIARTLSYIQLIVYVHTLLRLKHVRLLGAQELPRINYRGAVQRPGRRLFLDASDARDQ